MAFSRLANNNKTYILLDGNNNFGVIEIAGLPIKARESSRAVKCVTDDVVLKALPVGIDWPTDLSKLPRLKLVMKGFHVVGVTEAL